MNMPNRESVYFWKIKTLAKALNAFQYHVSLNKYYRQIQTKALFFNELNDIE